MMADDLSSTRPAQSGRNPPPGHHWLEILKRASQEAFATAFTRDVVLDASVTSADSDESAML